jgi:hypothetical protein
MLELMHSWDSVPVCSLIRGFPGVSHHIGTEGSNIGYGSTAKRWNPPSLVLFAATRPIVAVASG